MEIDYSTVKETQNLLDDMKTLIKRYKGSLAAIDYLKSQIESLTEEIERLKTENDMLKERLDDNR